MKSEHEKYILENMGKKPAKKIARELNTKERKISRFLKRYEVKKKHLELRKESETQPKKWTLFASVALIVILGFAVYGNSLDGKFVWDDQGLVTENTYIKSYSHISTIFATDIAAGIGKQFNFYRPLQMLTYMIDYSLWKLDVRGYHLTNILLHILVALAVFWLVTILYEDRLLSLLTSILFVVHPLHTEAVAYISGRADSLVGLFMLLCTVSYIRHIHSTGIAWLIFSILSYILALLSRENSLILPALLLLYHYSFKKKLKPGPFSAILATAFIYVLLRTAVLRCTLSNVTSPATSLLQRIPGFLVALVSYIRLLFLPFNLHMEYGNRLFSFSDPRAVLGIVILLSLLIYLFRKEKGNQLAFFSMSWFLVALLPASNFYPINAYMAEHWLYLPSIGFFLLIAKGLIHIYQLYQRKTLWILAMVFTMGLSAFYSYLTIRQNTYWNDPLVLYKRTLKYTPNNPRVHYNLGNAYNAINEMKNAIASYKKAIEIDSDHAMAYYNLGNAYKTIGKKQEAIASYKKAIEINPDHAEAYNNLGNTYNSINKKMEAMVSYKKAIEINPNLARAHHNLGLVYSTLNKNEEAIASYKKAIEINPSFAETYNNLALICFNNKQYKLAIEYCERAKELGFTNAALLKNLKPYRK